MSDPVSIPSTPPKINPFAAERRAQRARRAVINQWRGQDWELAEKNWKIPAQSAGTVLERVMKGLRLDDRMLKSKIPDVWKAHINPVVTAHAKPGGWAKGTLFINVDSTVWHAEIMRYHREEILERMQSALGKDVIQKISFRVM